MKKYVKFLSAIVFSAAISQSLANACEPGKDGCEECPLALSVGTSVVSDYIFRGFNLYDGISIQPSSTFSYTLPGEAGTLSAGLWAHLSAEGDRQEEKFTELDESITYDITLGAVDLTVGHVWYTYPDSNDDINDSAEFFGIISVPDLLIVPTLAVYHDYRTTDAQTYEFSLKHEFTSEDLGENASLTPYATFGFASNAEDVYADNGLEYISEGVSLSVPLGKFTVTPSVAYTHKVDDNTVNEFFAGTNVSYDF